MPAPFENPATNNRAGSALDARDRRRGRRDRLWRRQLVDEALDEIEVERREADVVAVEVDPARAEPRVGFGEHEQVTGEVVGYRLGRVDAPPLGDDGRVAATAVEHDDRRQHIARRFIGNGDRVRTGDPPTDLLSDRQRHRALHRTPAPCRLIGHATVRPTHGAPPPCTYANGSEVVSWIALFSDADDEFGSSRIPELPVDASEMRLDGAADTNRRSAIVPLARPSPTRSTIRRSVSVSAAHPIVARGGERRGRISTS